MFFLACDTADTNFIVDNYNHVIKILCLFCYIHILLPFTHSYCVFIKIMEEKEDIRPLAISATPCYLHCSINLIIFMD